MAYDEEDEGSLLEQEIEDLEEEQRILEQIDAEQQAKLALEEKVLKNRLKQIFRNVATSGKTSLSITDKQRIKKAKAFPNLKDDIKKINTLLNSNKVKAVSKLMSASPVLVFVGIGFLLIFLIIAVIAAVGSIMPWLFGEENNGEIGAAFGIKGTDFYGARMVYADDEKATLKIVEDYAKFVENGILQVKQITSVTASNGGESFDVALTINITLPSEDYNYSTFEENQFKTDYIDLYTVIYDIAKIVYKADNSTDYTGTSLIECVNGIKYFGFANIETIKQNVLSSIVSKTSYASSNDIENKLTQNDINSAVETKLNEFYSDAKYALRTEKLFVKDYILEGDKMISGITKQNYVAMIFMPRKNVTFTKISFSVGGSNLTELVINVNGTNLTSDGNNLGTEEKQTYIYGKNVNISANKFEHIDENNLNALNGEMSLFDIVENVGDYSIYLQNPEGANYLTLKTANSVVVEIENNEAFYFMEYETMWQTAS